jgi:hypothetical protein
LVTALVIECKNWVTGKVNQENRLISCSKYEAKRKESTSTRLCRAGLKIGRSGRSRRGCSGCSWQIDKIWRNWFWTETKLGKNGARASESVSEHSLSCERHHSNVLIESRRERERERETEGGGGKRGTYREGKRRYTHGDWDRMKDG